MSEIEVFGQETGGHICYIGLISNFRQNRVLKRSSEILGINLEFLFLRKGHSKISAPPKVGAKSPPMRISSIINRSHMLVTYQSNESSYSESFLVL